MTRYFKSLALLAVLSIAAVGCQKENIVESQTAMQITQNVGVRNITYTIDGVIFYTTIRGEQHWQVFLDSMFALVKEGHRVSIKNSDISSNGSQAKQTVTYTTSSQSDAIDWCNKMIGAGYEVSSYYDERTGKYVCIAVGPDIANPQTDTTDTSGAK